MSKLAGIHGLRFAAAMMVLASHVSPLTEVPAPDAIGWLVPYLGSGVFLFVKSLGNATPLSRPIPTPSERLDLST